MIKIVSMAASVTNSYLDMIASIESFLNLRTGGHSPEVLSSGLSFVFMQLAVATLLRDEEVTSEDIKKALDLSALYTLVDHFSDDPKVDTVQKKELYNFLLNPSDDACSGMYRKIHAIFLEYSKTSKNELRSLATAVVESSTLQNCKIVAANEDLRSKLKYASLNKGNKTMELVESVFGITVSCNPLGEAIQLVDDIIDVDEDILSGISTTATYDFLTTGSLERSVSEALAVLDNVRKELSFITVFLKQCIYHKVDTAGVAPLIGRNVHVREAVNRFLSAMLLNRKK